ncbi:MAG TPA: protein translocase subunit SecF [Gemmatimonadales bacterium]|nr:protein translocase subunit SecF [Gemmatimonadales bacterium]
MTRIFANANYDFIGLRRWAYGVTAALLLIGLIGYAIFGLNYSVEFTGGTLVQIETRNAVDVASLRTGLDQAGVLHAEIQQFGSDREYVIRARTAAQGTDADNTEQTTLAVTGALDKVLGTGTYTIARTEGVGPKVGAELRQKALFAILLSFVAVLAYLAYRFEWRFGLAAVIATAHDILTTLGFIAIMKIEVSLVVVGAVLSMVGYSLNDTIIIFDRVREDLRKMRGVPFATVLNRAINETLPRSVLTHGTTLSTLLALALLGGEVIRPFALVMFFGVFTGTFSSIFIASPVLLWIEKKWPGAAVRHLGSSASTPKPAPASTTGSGAKPGGRKAQPVA